MSNDIFPPVPLEIAAVIVDWKPSQFTEEVCDAHSALGLSFSMSDTKEPATTEQTATLIIGIEFGMRIMQARFDAVAMIDTPQYRNGWSEGKTAGLSEGWSDAIESIRASLKEFLNCGGDVVIMQEVQRLIGEAVAARGQDPWQGVTG